MFQALHGPDVITVLGYVSGIATCVSGIVAIFGKSDTKFGHLASAFGLDVAKLYRLLSDSK